MARRIAAALLGLILGGTIALATAEPAHARDTGWDCPGCRTR